MRSSTPTAANLCLFVASAWLSACGQNHARDDGGIELDDAAVADAGPSSLRPGVYALDGQEFDLPSSDLAPLASLIGDAQIVGLGEVVHSSGGLYELKARVIRHMVADLGFRLVVIESNWLASAPLARYVETCDGDLPALLAARTVERAYATREVETLVEWLCQWNAEHPEDPVRFTGFDVREPWSDSPALRDFLERAAPAQTESMRADLSRCIAKESTTEAEYHALFAGGEIPHTPDDHTACVAALDAAVALLDGSEAELIGATSAEDVALARLHAIGLRAVEGQVFLWPNNVPGATGTSFVGSIEARAIGLAERLDGLRELRYAGLRTVVWAANIHVQYDLENASGSFEGAGAREMGALLRSAHGDDYRAIAAIAHELYVAPPGEAERLHGEALATDAFERILSGLGHDHLLVDVAAQDLVDARAHRQLGFLRQVPLDQYDAVFFMESSRGAVPVTP